MRVLKYTIFASLILVVAACSNRTPEPLVKEDIQASAQEDYELLKDSTADVPVEIDLYQAISIAIKNNRELRTQIMDSALTLGQIDVVKFDMLPKLSANAGYKVLEKHPASTSVSMVTEKDSDGNEITGTENTAANAIGNSPTYSISQETPSYTNDIGFTWNALDFGLSYVRAGQQADRYLISKELERKAIHNLTKEVIYAYWKTLSADELLAQINPLMDRVNKALDDYEYIEELLISSPMDALLYQKELLDVAQILNTQRRALMDSRAQLANLLGLMPDQEFILVNTDKPLSELDMSLLEQEEAALFSRPELLEIRYQEKVTAAEARASMLSLFPSLTFNATWTYDSNKYLLNKDNTEYGALFGVNLLNVFQAGNINDVNKINEQIIKEQRLALSMAVLSQVHIANINYAQNLREYSNAKHYLNVAQRINELIANAQKISRFGELEVIREEASLLVARLRNDIAYAELQYSLGTLYSSVGMNFVPDNLAQVSDEELAMALEDKSQMDNQISELVSQGLLEWKWEGEVENVDWYYSHASCLVIPSRWEGVPNVLVEAMLAGCPVVSTPVSDIPNILGNSERGILCEGIEADQIADGIRMFGKLNSYEIDKIYGSLDKVLKAHSKLKKSEIVKSIRGTQGGYILSKNPHDIKLKNIFNAVDEKVKTVQCKKDSKKGCNGRATKCITHNLWDELENHINSFFEKKSLEDLINKRESRL